jgi:hypothetical protein
MPAIKLIAVGHDHRGAHTLQTVGEQSEYIKCRLVRPLRVVDHHDRRRPSPELAPQRHRHVMRRCSPLDQLSQLAADNLGDVKQRPEWPRREQRIANTPEHPRPASLGVTERSYQCCLPDTRLTGDEHQRSLAVPRLCQRPLQRSQFACPLQQAIVLARRR